MKKSIVFILLSLTMGLSHASEPFVGVYGVTDGGGYVGDYVGKNSGIIGGVKIHNFAMAVFDDQAERGERGITFRIAKPVNSFSYSFGLGLVKEHARLSDTTGNWDATSIISNSELALLGLLQVDHRSGIFFRYYRYHHDNTFLFQETILVGDTQVVLDEKTITKQEYRNKYMLGYKYHF